MPSYLTGVSLGELPKATTRAERAALKTLDDWDDHTFDSYVRVLEAASRVFPRITLEATLEDGDSLARHLVRARRGKATAVLLGHGVARAPQPAAIDGIKLAFPKSIATAIDDYRARGGSTQDLMRLLWDRFEKQKKKISAADVETVRARFAMEKQNAKLYFVGDDLRRRMKREADARGTKVSPLLTYACATFGRRLLKLRR